MKVPLLDLKEQYQSIRSEIEPAVLNLMENQTFVLGPVVAEFEKNLAQYSQCTYAIGVSSGPDALLCSMMAMGIGPGDEVIVPTFTFFGSAGAISRTGATPVFVDVDPDTFNLDVECVEQAITDRTRAIMPVHLFGQMAPMGQIMAIAKKSELQVIEDACQSIGSRQEGKMTGQWGDCSCLSFYPSKNLAGFGDGGAILCQDEKLDQMCRFLRMHGENKRYNHSYIGGNFRLDALQALVLDIKLRHLDRWVAKRRANAVRYNERLCDAVKKPVILPENESVYNQYVIRTGRRDALQDYLKQKEIGTAIYYPVPLHLQECFSELGGKTGDCPVAEEACKEVLALPIYPELTESQIDSVADSINSFFGK